MYNKLRCLKKFVAGLLATGTATVYFFTSGDVTQRQSIDYDEYVGKEWVAEGWHGENDEYQGYNALFHFCISQAENGMIEGTFAVRNHVSVSTTTGIFTGSVIGDTAECKLYNTPSEQIGLLTLKFLENNRIDATIELTESYEICKHYVFRPYNIMDVGNLRIHQEFERTVELDEWGQVNIVAGVLEGNKPYPVIYLTNFEGDILHDFSASYQVASEVYEIEVNDYDGDGLQDVKIITYFPYEPDSVFFERVFYQTQDGGFKQGESK